MSIQVYFRVNLYLLISRWIGTNGPIKWPARSPDLTPNDYFLWGYLKSMVYSTEPTTLEDLQQRILNTCRNIPIVTLRKTVTNGILRRFEACASRGGMHFEHEL